MFIYLLTCLTAETYINIMAAVTCKAGREGAAVALQNRGHFVQTGCMRLVFEVGSLKGSAMVVYWWRVRKVCPVNSSELSS